MGWLESAVSDIYEAVEKSKFISHFNVSSFLWNFISNSQFIYCSQVLWIHSSKYFQQCVWYNDKIHEKKPDSSMSQDFPFTIQMFAYNGGKDEKSQFLTTYLIFFSICGCFKYRQQPTLFICRSVSVKFFNSVIYSYILSFINTQIEIVTFVIIVDLKWILYGVASFCV